MAKIKDIMDKRPTAGIILAAGMSTRFGRLKQLHEINDSTILSMVVDAAVRSDLDKVVLVLGHEADAVAASLGERIVNSRILKTFNDRYREGMSTSLQRGLMEIRDEYPSIMVLMGDQPLLGHEVINLVLEKFRSTDKGICVPVYRGTRGLPVCFTERFYNDILTVKGDMGAREVIKNNPTDISTLEMDDPNPFMDIDEEADLERLRSLLKER